MADFLTAVKTARVIPEKEAEAGLTAVKTSKPQPAQELQKPRGTESTRKTGTPSSSTPVKDAATPEEAVRVLRSQPDAETLLTILRKLSLPDGFPAFHLDAPGPLQAQILNTIVGDTIPSFWPTLQAGEKALVVRCLRNVTGINALLANLRAVSSPGGVSKRSDLAGQRASLIRVTGQVFDGHTVILDLLTNLNRLVTDKIRRDLAQKEIVNLFGSGKVISTVAQAEDAARQSDQSGAPAASWLAVGSEYTGWFGRNIAALFDQKNEIPLGMYGEVRGPGGLLLAKALNLGYQSALVKGLVSEVVSRSKDGFTELMEYVPKYAKRQFLERTLRWLSEFCPSAGAATHTGENISSIAALLTALVQSDQIVCTQHARAICSDPNLTVVLSQPVRRACIATLSGIAPDELQNLLETLMTTFSDRIFIDHSPVLQQDSLAQTLLLAAGCLHRANPVAVLMIARSSGHMQGTSNRLDASGQRARWLGMVVATAISGLVDREGSRMEFGVDEAKTEEALWYLNLVKVQDRVGALSDFGALLARQDKAVKPARKLPSAHAKALPSLNGKLVFGPPRPPTPAQTEVIGERVTELLDDVSDEEDDDLKPYAKPDSDPEDSDEDATLVNRNKPRPPVYVRDLMSMLRDDKTPDRFQLGMKHAAPLIRRKANFGREVKDHAEELMGLLCNLQDPFDTEQFEELKLQAMIAILLSDVDAMGPWLSTHAFVEGYSIAQRCTMLSALGLGGRELAGFKDEDDLNPALPNTGFPSKRLPARLHATYTNAAPNKVSVRLNSTSKKIEDHLMHPLALQAADHSTAHLNAVKVRTFSSRMAVERTKRKPAPNQLAKSFARSFFFPLANRYQQELAAYGLSSVFASAPVVLVTFLETLALLFHASGPATVGLPELTMEFWDLLLSLRVKAAGDIAVLGAVLFAALTLLDVNTADQRRLLAQEEAKRVVEMQQWVQVVFERAGGGEMVSGGSEEEAKIRTLAAGVLVKIGEMVEEYQKGMFGRITG